MTDIKKKAIAVTCRDFWQLLIDAGVKVPDYCADVIIEARAGGVVQIYYRCFADQKTVDTAAAVIFRVESELADKDHSSMDRAQRMFAAYWRVTTGLQGEGWKDAWEILPDDQKGGWIQAVFA